MPSLSQNRYEPVTLAFPRASKIEAMLKPFALAGLLFLASALGLASCGSETASSPGTATSPVRTVSNPYTNPIKREGSSPARLIGDGRYFGYVRAADAESQPPEISFDVAQFFFGKDVQKAAEADGVVSPGDPVPNDHYQRNPVQEDRALQLAPEAVVSAGSPASFLLSHVSRETRKKCGSQPPGAGCVSLPEFFAAARQIKDYASGYPGIPVWVTIRDGLVVRIDEQYFP